MSIDTSSISSISDYTQSMQLDNLQEYFGDSSSFSQMIMKMADKDGDGEISSDEVGLPEQIFASFDRDGSGSISSEELASEVEDKMQGFQEVMQMLASRDQQGTDVDKYRQMLGGNITPCYSVLSQLKNANGDTAAA